MRNRSKWILCMGLAFTMAASVTLSGCGTGKKDSGKTEIELVQYKPEAVKAFEKLEEKFNATHDDIHLTIESPNDAMTVLKTRFIREDNPDIIGIGGDVNFSNFIDSDMLMDISDYQGLDSIKDAYKEIDKALEFVRKTESMRFLTWPTPPESFTIVSFSRSMAGRSRLHGMNL